MSFLKKLLFVLALLLAPLAMAADQPVNINTADVKTLDTVKGIGPKKAQAIVDYRTKHGPFKSVDDLTNVPGIKGKTLEKLRPNLTVGEGAPAKAPAASAPAKPAAGGGMK